MFKSMPLHLYLVFGGRGGLLNRSHVPLSVIGCKGMTVVRAHKPRGSFESVDSMGVHKYDRTRVKQFTDSLV